MLGARCSLDAKSLVSYGNSHCGDGFVAGLKVKVVKGKEV